MKITIDVELKEEDVAKAPYVQKALESLNPQVSTRVVTDKDGLCSRIKESIKTNDFESITQELLERLTYPSLLLDALDCLCEAAFFSAARVQERASSEPFLSIFLRLPAPQKDEIKLLVVERAMKFLSIVRRLDCSRSELLPYADTLATMVKMDLLGVRNAINSFSQMVRLETMRTAGITCLGKLVEIAYEKVRHCDTAILEALRVALSCAQQDEIFLYDIEYIAENLGWFQNKPSLVLSKTSSHHSLPILTMAYHPGGNVREAVVTSSADGKVVTWDGSGKLLEIFTLSMHYGCSLDFSNSGQILLVGTVGRKPKTPPVVIFYQSRDNQWSEMDGVEPTKGDGFITVVRAFRNTQGIKYCVAASSSLTNHSLLVYDTKTVVTEYSNQSDIVTSICTPTENVIVAGSRDKTVVLYDIRSRQPAASSTPHTNSVSALSCLDNYIFSSGLDGKLIVQDMRMLGNVSFMRQMDSAILGLSVLNISQCAVSTLTGVQTINFSSPTTLPTASRANSGMNAPQYNAITWNAKGTLLFAGGESSTLDIYNNEFESS